MKAIHLFSAAFVAGCWAMSLSGQPATPPLPNPILFVTQVPQPADFTTVTAVFGNHRGDLESAPRGGDLWIRYPDGSLRNLTRAAGFGSGESQDGRGIAVREPAIHWSRTRAVFSMVVGAPSRQYELQNYYWQLYEIEAFADPMATPRITRIPNQPATYNNVAPTYGTDDRIIFASDRPRDGERHLWPQRDEYEEAPTVTGLWSLDPTSGDLFLLNHTPSGAFSPSIDRFGRLLFVRWDHLQRDQQADADADSNGRDYGTFNFSSEAADAVVLTNNRAEMFPERRHTDGALNGHTFNDFFPWMMHEDGSGEETLNHLGRHELGGSYRNAARNDDPNVADLYYFGNRFNTNILNNFLQLRESPTVAGRYLGIDAPEFGTHAAGQLVALNAPPETNPDRCTVDYLTPRATASSTADPAPPEHTGFYRNPLPLSDGNLAAVHTPETRPDSNVGSSTAPQSRYDFRLKLLQAQGTYWAPGPTLTTGLTATVSWWSPDERRSYSGALWELDPVEVVSRSRPGRLAPEMEPPERQVFREEGVALPALQRFLRERMLALVVGRDATTRDSADFQQPFNLHLPKGHQSIGSPGTVYEIAHLQFYQGDLIRGLGLRQPGDSPLPGRRVLAQRMHDGISENPTHPGGPESSVELADDGSFAAFVPARRALSWQLTTPQGEPVVRERYWITFQPGEVRVCGSCHGVNSRDQTGAPPPENRPDALRHLLRFWKNQTGYAELNVTPDGDGLQLAISAGTEQPHWVESSLDLRTWSPIATNPPNATGRYFNRLPGIDGEGSRFYRVRTP